MPAIIAVFLDRDGIVTPPLPKGRYLLNPDAVRLDHGASKALRRLVEHGLRLFIVTNQSCIGRSMISQNGAEAIQMRAEALLAYEGIPIADRRICPHVAEDGCACRKPKPGMILDLCRTHGIDPASTALVGDRPSDAEAGIEAGCALSILVGSGAKSGQHLPAPDLDGAVSRILAHA